LGFGFEGGGDEVEVVVVGGAGAEGAAAEPEAGVGFAGEAKEEALVVLHALAAEELDAVGGELVEPAAGGVSFDVAAQGEEGEGAAVVQGGVAVVPRQRGAPAEAEADLADVVQGEFHNDHLRS
jgi:hypothetical protein